MFLRTVLSPQTHSTPPALSLKLVLALCVAVVLTASLSPAQAQTLDFTGATETEEVELSDPLGRHTPRGLITGLIAALADGDMARVGQYLSATSRAPHRTLAEWEVARIERALNDAVEIDLPTDLSLVPEGALDDGLEADRERVGTIDTQEGSQALIAARQPGPASDTPIWLISTESVDLLLEWRSRRAGTDTWLRRLIERLPEGPEIAGAPTRDWAALLALGLVSYLCAWLVMGLRIRLLGFIRPRASRGRLQKFIEASVPPLRLLLTSIAIYLASGSLGVSIVARFQTITLVQFVAWFSLAWLAWRLIDAVGDASLSRMSARGAITAYSAITFVTRVMKLMVVIVFAAMVLRGMGVDLTAGIAAIGVGGLVLALGAQKLVENLIGSVTVVADRPVRVGDFCRFGETLGTVEEIGIRSTRIRTLSRTLVTVPNGEFSSLHLENLSARDRFLFHHTLGVRYEISPRSMETLLADLRKLLHDDPRVSADPARARFIRFGAYSLDIEVFAYVYAADWNAYLEIQEDLMLRAMEIVSEHSAFAFPSQTVYIGRDSIPAPRNAF